MAHVWRMIFQRGEGSNTDTVEQCCKCNTVRHSYLVASLDRQLTTVRHYDHGKSVAALEQCPPSASPCPELHDELPP